MGEAYFKLNFLDDLESDLPTGCWSLQIESSKTKVRKVKNFCLIKLREFKKFKNLKFNIFN